MEYVELNVKRLEHLMALYGVSKDELLTKLNGGNKRVLTEKDVFKSYISLGLLKKIDAIFEKGLSYYLDPKAPIRSNEESIFFRKDTFNAELNFTAKKFINKFEQEKLSISALAKLSDFDLSRKLPVYKLTDSPRVVASQVRKDLYPEFNYEKKVFLKNFIAQLAELDILVFEFIEYPRSKEKANINGIFIAPNVIILKRNQRAFRREIFTLAHELGHYLLNKEEIDDKISGDIDKYDKLSEIEKWCSDFAFYFLAGQYGRDIDNLGTANASNDYHHELINKISSRTHLSTRALYFRLWINKSVSTYDYNNINAQINKDIEAYEVERKRKLEIEKAKALKEGRKTGGANAKPIISPLYVNTLQSALYDGLITEWDFCKRLNINPKSLEKYLA